MRVGPREAAAAGCDYFSARLRMAVPGQGAYPTKEYELLSTIVKLVR